MLAEVFIMRLEMQLRIAATASAASDKRFVPLTPPRETPRKPA